MTVVLEMSTDPDIVETPLNAAWNPVTHRFHWNQVAATNLNIAGGSTIVVVAHGDGTEIGNADPGVVDINSQIFLALVHGNMANGTVPNAVYISTCAPGIAEFAANVSLSARQNQVWANTRIFGHADPVIGPVPPPNDIAWIEIYNSNLRRSRPQATKNAN